MPKRTNEISDQYVDCRAWQHAWQHAWKATDVSADGPAYIQHFTCLRGCNTVRHTRIHRRTGELMGSSYSYPEGYTLTGGTLSKSERGEIRLRAVG